MRTIIRNSSTAALVLCLFFSIKQNTFAQSNPLGASYFQNPFLINPAMAGFAGKGMNLNIGTRKQWTNIPGSPSTQAITTDFDLNGKAGIGMNLNRDKSGLVQRLRAMGTFAYHLPLDEANRALSFGISMGITNERINLEDVKGDQNDIILGRFNERQTYLDGDFGAAYTSDGITIQAAIPNLKEFVKKDQMEGAVDRAILFSAVSYRFKGEGTLGINIEPKAVYRMINGMDGILDFGANIIFGNHVNFFGMYHSSQSATFGLGMIYQNLGLSGIYNTSTGNLSQYASDNFEINLHARLFGKK
jgi:type IX secretion system PorP/SprF family membrane protein